jgi:ApaG protein
MTSKISGGVKISVETFYQPEFSSPLNSEFMFAYRISIENSNDFPIKLLSRHWHIFDSNGSLKEVQGEGVVGVQPVIAPADKYEYMSGCNLRSEIGRMHGTYLMEDLNTHRTFNVVIPSFEMQVPFKMN